ncbi:Transcription initiation factor IIE subunit beta [Smittium mucronatum]|uniref:Transcription initiation factor IIE subunit beta n=1 Tax=Smittium mucronatum TaxID=133383 RepID=A0A1R0H0E2_9FUNG|nr:Transcription initiation factor IIE subunit beta [Smittium mucronatum]
MSLQKAFSPVSSESLNSCRSFKYQKRSSIPHFYVPPTHTLSDTQQGEKLASFNSSDPRCVSIYQFADSNIVVPQPVNVCRSMRNPKRSLYPIVVPQPSRSVPPDSSALKERNTSPEAPEGSQIQPCLLEDSHSLETDTNVTEQTSSYSSLDQDEELAARMELLEIVSNFQKRRRELYNRNILNGVDSSATSNVQLNRSSQSWYPYITNGPVPTIKSPITRTANNLPKDAFFNRRRTTNFLELPRRHPISPSLEMSSRQQSGYLSPYCHNQTPLSKSQSERSIGLTQNISNSFSNDVTNSFSPSSAKSNSPMSSLLRKHEEFKKSVVSQPVYKKPTVHQQSPTPQHQQSVQCGVLVKELKDSFILDLPAAVQELVAKNQILTINNKDGSPRILFFNRYQPVFGSSSEVSSKISPDFKSIWFELRVPDETDLGFEMEKAGLKQMQVDKRKTVEDDDKKSKKNKNRRIKITNTHLEGIDLTKDYVPTNKPQ